MLLWAGQFVSQIGDRLAALAFPWLVYTSTGSALGTGAVFAVYTLPYVLFGALAGVAVDRFDKRRLMITVDLSGWSSSSPYPSSPRARCRPCSC